MFCHRNVKHCLNNVWPVRVCEVENMEQNTRPQENASEKCFGFFVSYIYFCFLLLWEVTRVFLLGAPALWDFPACGLWLWNLPLIINWLSSNSSSTLSGLIGRGNLNGTSLALRACFCVSLYLAQWKCRTATCYALRKSCFCWGIHLKRIGVPIQNRFITWCRPIVTNTEHVKPSNCFAIVMHSEIPLAYRYDISSWRLPFTSLGRVWWIMSWQS